MDTTQTEQKRRTPAWGLPFDKGEMDHLLSDASKRLEETDRLEHIHQEWFDQIRELQFEGNHTSPL